MDLPRLSCFYKKYLFEIAFGGQGGGVVEGRMAGAGGDEEVGGGGGGGGRRRGWDGREREVWVGDRGIWEEVAVVRS